MSSPGEAERWHGRTRFSRELNIAHVTPQKQLLIYCICQLILGVMFCDDTIGILRYVVELLFVIIRFDTQCVQRLIYSVFKIRNQKVSTLF